MSGLPGAGAGGSGSGTAAHPGSCGGTTVRGGVGSFGGIGLWRGGSGSGSGGSSCLGGRCARRGRGGGGADAAGSGVSGSGGGGEEPGSGVTGASGSSGAGGDGDSGSPGQDGLSSWSSGGDGWLYLGPSSSCSSGGGSAVDCAAAVLPGPDCHAMRSNATASTATSLLMDRPCASLVCKCTSLARSKCAQPLMHVHIYALGLGALPCPAEQSRVRFPRQLGAV